ncbi:hypothetical protein [Microbacterium sp. A84]|uniref:hypothetical protein n=1 Tax=Microbacterium sp. A84 TaxID=3450715 RepID=UPI003F42E091
MTSDADDALSWDGDDDGTVQKPVAKPVEKPVQKPVLPHGWNAVGKDSESVGRPEDDIAVAEPAELRPLSTPMLLIVGIIGGVYLLYTVGWIVGGLKLQGSALFLIPGVMYQVALWAAVLAPALWFVAVWLLTRRSAGWIRVLGLLAGAVLLVPWPFVMTGVVGS